MAFMHKGVRFISLGWLAFIGENLVRPDVYLINFFVAVVVRFYLSTEKKFTKHLGGGPSVIIWLHRIYFFVARIYSS